MSDKDMKKLLDEVERMAKQKNPNPKVLSKFRKLKIRKQLACYEIMGKIEKLVNEKYDSLNINLGGHYESGRWIDRKFVERLLLDFRIKDNHLLILDSMRQALESGIPSKTSIKFGGNSLFNCSVCDEYITYTFDGVTLGAENKCPYPNGIPEISFELPVPSGKLVVANDLRYLFEDEYEEVDLRPNSRGWGFNINSDLGCVQVFQTYGKLGMAHGFVGNSCLSMYRIDRTTLTLSMVEHDEETYKHKELPGERVAGVCTDLWWYSVVDYRTYVARAGKEPNKYCDVVDVKPGMYKVIQRTHMIDRDANVTDHYAVFKWVRNLRLKDFVNKREPLVTTVEDTIKMKLVTGDESNRAMALNELFFTIGAGYKWVNGCIICSMTPKKFLDNLPNSNIKQPKDLEKRMKDMRISKCYPICEYSKVNQVPDDVKPDWLNAAFEALDMAINLNPTVKCEASGWKNSVIIEEAKKSKKSLEERFGRR